MILKKRSTEGELTSLVISEAVPHKNGIMVKMLNGAERFFSFMEFPEISLTNE